MPSRTLPYGRGRGLGNGITFRAPNCVFARSHYRDPRKRKSPRRRCLVKPINSWLGRQSIAHPLTVPEFSWCNANFGLTLNEGDSQYSIMNYHWCEWKLQKQLTAAIAAGICVRTQEHEWPVAVFAVQQRGL